MRLLVLALTVSVAHGASGASLLTAYRAAAAPVIDGVLDEACWRSTIVSSHFLNAGGPGLPLEQTRVRVCWDDSFLYIGGEAFEGALAPALNMLHLVKAEKKGRDAGVFSDDCVEVFLQPTSGTYYHFAMNSGSGTYEGEGKSPAWHCEWRSAVKRGTKSYVFEMAIPLQALAAKPQGEWRVNFTRHRPHAKELSTWCGLQGGFHQPESFGVLRFALHGPAVGPVTLNFDTSGRCDAQVTLGGSANQESAFRLYVAEGKRKAHDVAKGSGRKKLTVSTPAQARRISIGYELLQGQTVIAASAPYEEAIAAGLARMSLSTKGCTARVFLNGAEVALTNGTCPLKLEGGANIVAIEATATGKAPSLLPSIEADGHPIRLSWGARSDAPASDWRECMPTNGWHTPVAANGLWSSVGEPRAYLAAAIYVGKDRPQFFPHMDTFYLPRGSKQLLKVYMHTPSDVPAEDYRMVVEVPSALKLIAADMPEDEMARVIRTGRRVVANGQTMARHEAAYDVLPGQGMELSLRWGDHTGHTLAYQPSITAGGTFGWRHLSMRVKPPKGVVSVHPLIIKWQKRGITGTFWVDNLAFREADSDENLLKMGTFDEAGWGRNSRLCAEGADGSKCVKIVAKPEWVDRQQALWVDKAGTEGNVIPVDPDKTYVVELDVRCEKVGSPSAKALCSLLFEAPRDLREGGLPIYTYFETFGGRVVELPVRSRLRVLPPLKNVRPEQARISPCYYGPRFKHPEVGRAYAENCWASGITWTYGKTSNDVVPHLLNRGHKVFLSIGWHAWGVPAGARSLVEEHPELQAVDFKGKRLHHQFCPTWMLSKGDAVLAALEDWLLGVVNENPYAGANWDLEQPVIDPPTFCTCERCFAAFRAFAKLPTTTKLDPKIILGKYPTQWTDFRCTQNAEMAGHLKRILRKASRPIEFSLYSGYQCRRTKEHYGVDWQLMAPHLDLGIAGYGGGRTQIRDTVKALAGVPFMGGEMWYLSQTDDARPRPRMETWRNRILRQYVESGCNGCLIWWLASMDGGAFYATSEAAEIIAKYEDYFVASQRCDGRVRVSGVDARNWAAFAKDGRTLLLLLNFHSKVVDAAVSVDGRERAATIDPYGASVIVVD